MSLPHFIGRGLTEQERDAFGYWLSGFVDGEGFFMLSKRELKGMPHHTAMFGITLRKDDIHILKKICEFLGCGAVRNRSLGKSTAVNGKPEAGVYVYDSYDLKQKAIPVFEKYPLRAKKARDFVIWKQAVELIVEVKSRKSRPIHPKTGYARGCLPKWTQEEIDLFTKLWADLRRVREYQEPCDSPSVTPKLKMRPKKISFDLFPDGKW